MYRSMMHTEIILGKSPVGGGVKYPILRPALSVRHPIVVEEPERTSSRDQERS
jgi:hypothetical protein